MYELLKATLMQLTIEDLILLNSKLLMCNFKEKFSII